MIGSNPGQYLAESDIYLSLIEGTARRTLDDGEAATIGCAQELGGVALIDERKARTICTTDFPGLALASMVDLLLHECVRGALGRRRLQEAVISALQLARMRVPPDRIDTVVDLIGEEAAARCHSLPKARRAAS